ncbi:hypothetical protein V2H77_09330 [Photorhabdus sp. P32]|uniref:hypothetical protein n=1 Tax=Photorhabdus sp. P32 TaxID=3117549 RepID=UPI00311B263B
MSNLLNNLMGSPNKSTRWKDSLSLEHYTDIYENINNYQIVNMIPHHYFVFDQKKRFTIDSDNYYHSYRFQMNRLQGTDESTTLLTLLPVFTLASQVLASFY